MSKINKHKISNQPSGSIQQLFQQAATKLGIEIANERRAVRMQTELENELVELEAAFNIAANREKETAEAKARDEARKLKVTPTPAPTTTPETGSAQDGSSASGV